MSFSIPAQIYVDARPLQDPHYRFRGVGQHSTSLLSALHKYEWRGKRPLVIGMIDGDMEDIHREHASLFDILQERPRYAMPTSWFISLSPMTHDPIKVSSFLENTEITKIALFYDLIQLRFPERYLSSPLSRVEFITCFAWLNRYDIFAAISQHSGDDLAGNRAIDPAKIFVSGVAVRDSLLPDPSEDPLPRSDRTHILVAGGGDPRKNPECALIAHARSQIPEVRDLPIYVFGNYPAPFQANLASIFKESGGDPEKLVFLQHLADEELKQLYKGAVLTVVPSRAEGFSIPIVESAAAGTPVAVSTVDAHPELIANEQLQFDPDDPDALALIMERVILREEEWLQHKAEVATVWPQYTANRVGQRFIEGVIARHPNRAVEAPAVMRQAKPQIAVLTPLPPSQSGVADYSAATLSPLSRYADLHIFTDSKGAPALPIYHSMAAVNSAQFSARTFDQRISVLGNSHFHKSIFEHLMKCGGAALAHDARMIDFYLEQLGVAHSREVGRNEWQRDVSADLLKHWISHQDELPVLFLSEIAEAADILMVHSTTTAHKIDELYGKKPSTLPFAQYRPIGLDQLNPICRRASREALGWSSEDFVITTFGFVSPDKSPELLISALQILRSWSVKARLVFCGLVGNDIAGDLRTLTREMGLTDAVTFLAGRASEQVYIDHLIATDAAIQLRTYFMGGLSGALNDCIAAAIPSVSNTHLAEASLAPSFVRRVANRPSPQMIAEAMLDIIESGDHRNRPLAEALSFSDAHSFERYAALMMQTLGFDVQKAV